MADEVPGLIDIVGFIADAMGKGQAVLSFFQGGQPTMADIAKAFAAEVKQIFSAELAQEDIRTATAHLKAAQQFFAQDYRNAVNNGQTNDQLKALINGSDGPGLANLRADANLMATWVGDPSLIDGGQATVNEAASLYFAIQLFICMIHRELSRIESDPAVKATELDNAKSAAKDALDTMKDVAMKIIANRCQSVSVGSWSRTVRTPPPDPSSRAYFGATLVDSWLHGSGGYTLNTTADTPHGPSDGANAAMQGLIGPYQHMLWYGGQDAEDALNAAIGSAGVPGDSSSTFTSNDLQALRDFAKWANKVRTSLLGLDRISRGAWVDLQRRRVLGHLKQQNWQYCNGCGVLYQFGPFYSAWQGTVQQVCPAYGMSHRSAVSSVYLLSFDAIGSSSDSQDSWTWCEACGSLFHTGAGNRCPMNLNGPHTSSSGVTYYVMYGDNNDDDKDIQAGWRWCNKCAQLHWPSGPSKCPAGGSHSTDGSGHYRVESLGKWGPPVVGPGGF
jgi:hypothetical protein